MSDITRALTLRLESDGVAVITFDTPGSPVNIISSALFGELAEILDAIERDALVRACVLASGKPDSFIAGADIRELLGFTHADEGERFSRAGHELLDRLASSPKPIVAALHGPALGGGLEVALACHFRLASDDASTVLGLPEVTLGLLPGGGGTQRLPDVVGLSAALPMLLTGERVRARKAYRIGLVDALAPAHGLVATAAGIALRLAEGSLAPRTLTPPLMSRVLDAPLVRPLVLSRARRAVAAKTRGLYPAPPAILECVETGLTRGRDAGAARESALFGRLAASAEAKSLMRLFVATTELKSRPAVVEPRPVSRVAIVGAGFMGAGIASVSVPRWRVTLQDVSAEALGKAARTIRTGLARRAASGSIARLEADRQWSRARLTQSMDDAAQADLFVEAVFEDLELKREVLARVEAIASPEAVFASNTSALPIAAIAERARRPERVLGMHYFSPVHKMPLLEIVAGPATAAWAIETARAVGIAQGKTVIVVRDGPGFYTTRILAPFLNEAVSVLREGADMRALDEALRNYGFPVGPVTLLDEVGIDVAAHVSAHLGSVFAERGLAASDALERLIASGYRGRKNGRGFYRYDRRSSSRLHQNEHVYEFFGGPERRAIAPFDTAERLALLLVNEAAHCLQEGIIASPGDGDVGAVLGLGFPPTRGGPFRLVDSMGAARVVARLEHFARELGERFRPAQVLVDHAQEGRTFHDLDR